MVGSTWQVASCICEYSVLIELYGGSTWQVASCVREYSVLIELYGGQHVAGGQLCP